MILLILSLFAQADETQITEIDFESVEIIGEVRKPRFQRIVEVKRPTFKSLATFCVREMFDPIVEIETK